MVLKTKLDHGTSNMLAIIMGIVNANKERPLETSTGESLNENMTVNSPRKIIAAILPDQKLLIKYTINTPARVTILPKTIKLVFSHFVMERKTTPSDIVMAITQSMATLTRRMLRILRRRVSSGSAVEIVRMRSKNSFIIF